jgi:hypothetical protein
MQLWQYCLLITARSLYMFRTLSASIVRSAKTVVAPTGACHGLGWYVSSKDVQSRLPLHYVVGYLGPVAATSVFVRLMMDAESVQNM